MGAISSTSNPIVKRIGQLIESRRQRRKEGAFFIEGAPFVKLARDTERPIELVVVCEELLTEEAGQILGRIRSRGDVTSFVQVTERVFAAISDRNNPDGLAAIVKAAEVNLHAVDPAGQRVIPAFVDIQDPGNLGTVLRICDATGARTMILTRESSDPFHPRALRASRGSIFTVSICHADSVDAMIDWARDKGMCVFATSARGAVSPWSMECRKPILLLFGNEHSGLEADTLQKADAVVTLPMLGKLSSVNVAVTAAVLLYEFVRRQTAQGTARLRQGER
jgi:TrmH family RNA methyltransferase